MKEINPIVFRTLKRSDKGVIEDWLIGLGYLLRDCFLLTEYGDHVKIGLYVYPRHVTNDEADVLWRCHPMTPAVRSVFDRLPRERLYL